MSYNCPDDKKCGRNADEPIHPPTYSFVLIGLGIVICQSLHQADTGIGLYVGLIRLPS